MKDTPIYSFYNPTRRNHISITASSEKDNENVYSKLKSDLTDIYLRKYFIKLAKKDFDKFLENMPKQKEIKEEKSILTADEAAKYLRMSKKTLQNLASVGKIKNLKGGKYRLQDLDIYLESGSRKKKKLLIYIKRFITFASEKNDENVPTFLRRCRKTRETLGK